MIKTKSNTVHLCISLCAAALGVAFGCSDDEDEIVESCKWKYDKQKECPSPGSADEVGDGDGDKDDGGNGAGIGVAEEFCSVDDTGRERTVYQCDGMLKASMHFDTLKGDCAKTLGDPAFCNESHVFGVESYDMPAVMACCDLDGTPEQEDEILTYCAMDLVEQVCRSIPLRLQSLIEKEQIKVGENQAARLMKWLKSHQQDCYDALYSFSGTPGVIRPTEWLVNGGNNKQWPLLNNFTISLEKAVVKSAVLPEDESEYLTCFDNSLNDGEIFEPFERPSTPGVIKIKHLGGSSAAPISGPPLPNRQPVTGSATIASRGTGCQGSRCSSLAFSKDSATGALVLEDLNLFADGPTTIAFGPWSVSIDDAAVRLYGVSHADEVQGVYIIQAGEAHFVISGATAGAHGFRWATNDQPIAMRETSSGWLIDSFSVAHTDSAGGIWTITIPPTTWN